MRVLLDTNILIHREGHRVLNSDIGILFNWFDRLGYEKCIHPSSIAEIEKHEDLTVVRTIKAKLQTYNVLQTIAPFNDPIKTLSDKHDSTENHRIDSYILNEVYSNRVDFLITEDRNIHRKAEYLNVGTRVFTIDSFLEKANSENPELLDYRVLSVQKKRFGNIPLVDEFFNSFRGDYQGFDRWFNRKSDEIAYIGSSQDGKPLAFLYVKVEGKNENYSDITPSFQPKRRLKIGTFKVVSNGFKLGERFLKIVFDNALKQNVDEIYVTLFNKTEEHERLIGLLQDWGFIYHGQKYTPTGSELVYKRDMRCHPDNFHPKLCYPLISKNRRVFLTPIYPEYHTELLPDSILNNESPNDFIENQPHRNAIQKAYISRSYRRDLQQGDLVVFYRTGGHYRGVVTTIGVIDSVYCDIQTADEFLQVCRKRSVFSSEDLLRHWNFNGNNRPFVVNFLYLYSFPKRPNLQALKSMGVVGSAPRGFEEITTAQFEQILGASETDESFIIN